MSEIDYTIPAIPTLYRGRRFRSRLEARWAAFFDEMRWPYEYEPCDLGKWSPDFLLGQEVLVEVKPIVAFDREIGRRIADAAQRSDQNAVLLVGTAPFPSQGRGHLGWVGDVNCELEHVWNEAFVVQCPPSSYDICDRHYPYTRVGDELCVDVGTGNPLLKCARWEEVSAAWVRAANIVQWLPTSGRGRRK